MIQHNKQILCSSKYERECGEREREWKTVSVCVKELFNVWATEWKRESERVKVWARESEKDNEFILEIEKEEILRARVNLV